MNKEQHKIIVKTITELMKLVDTELLNEQELQDFAYETMRFEKKIGGAYMDRLTEHLKKKEDE